MALTEDLNQFLLEKAERYTTVLSDLRQKFIDTPAETRAAFKDAIELALLDISGDFAGLLKFQIINAHNNYIDKSLTNFFNFLKETRYALGSLIQLEQGKGL